jgi:hypothetical protein
MEGIEFERSLVVSIFELDLFPCVLVKGLVCQRLKQVPRAKVKSNRQE